LKVTPHMLIFHSRCGEPPATAMLCQDRQPTPGSLNRTDTLLIKYGGDQSHSATVIFRS
jgi:hypothetical protein